MRIRYSLGEVTQVDGEVVIGKAWGHDIQLCNPDGSAMDLTGCTFRCQVLLGDTEVADATVEATNPENGWVRLSMPPSETAKLTSRLVYDWGLEVTDAQDRPIQAFLGKMPAIRGVPRG